MDLILQIIKDSTESFSLFSFAVLLIICAKGITFTRELKVSTIYIIVYILLLFNRADNEPTIYILFATLFVLNELFINDRLKVRMFNIWEKLVDYSYKLLIEDYIIPYLASICLLWLSESAQTYRLLLLITSIALMVVTVFLVVKNNFSTKTVTEIIDILNGQNIFSGSGRITEKDKILLELEDSTFNIRNKHSHNMLSRHILIKIRKYIKTKYILHAIRTIKVLFSRGYATIEMQLIRSIGVENGYDRHIYRRKIFEIVYSNLIFNSLQREYNFEKSTQRFRKWIIVNYLYNVRIKLYERVYLPHKDNSTFNQLFEKEYNELTKEEFFIWCMGLTHISNIGQKTIGRRYDVIRSYNLNIKEIEECLNAISPYELKIDLSQLSELYL